MLSIVDRYFLSELSKIFGAIMATLMLVMTSMLLLRTLEQVNVGTLGSESVLRFLGLQILRDIASLLPPAFFIAALVTLGRMARDSELIAFHAGGLGPFRIYRSLLLFAVPLALVTGWFALIMQPSASAEIQRIEESRDDEATQIAGLQAGRFYQQDDGRITFYAADLGKDGRFHTVFIQDRRPDKPRIVLSRSAFYSERPQRGERAVVLEDGTRADGQPGQRDFEVGSFRRYTYFLEQDPEADQAHTRRSATPTAELLGSESLRDRAELGHRLSAPLAIIALAMLAIPLTTLSPRQRGSGRLMLAFLAYFAFFNLQRVAENWMQSEVTPAWLGMLWYQAAIVLFVYLALVPGSFWFRRVLWR
jgi:lipopolysaccharide export system permease protein